MPELRRYCAKDGRQPFSDWLNGLKDKSLMARIRMRLRRVETGNLGDCKSVGVGLLELRLHHGPGYRIYLGCHGDQLIILLGGGDKTTQQADIRIARHRWTDWKERLHEEIQDQRFAS